MGLFSCLRRKEKLEYILSFSYPDNEQSLENSLLHCDWSNIGIRNSEFPSISKSNRSTIFRLSELGSKCSFGRSRDSRSSSFFIEPEMRFAKLEDFRSKRIPTDTDFTVKHSQGSFKIRLFYDGIVNPNTRFSKTANNCEATVKLSEPTGSASLFWQTYISDEITLKGDVIVDPQSAQSVFDAIKPFLFKTKKMSLHRGDGKLIVIGFALETIPHKFYFASDILIEQDLRIISTPKDIEEMKSEKPSGLVRVNMLPFQIVVSGPDIQALVGDQKVMFGSSWDKCSVGYMGKEVRLKGDEYMSSVKLSKGMERNQK